MPAGAPSFLDLLTTLRGHDVDFIVIGGVCAVLHGAPVSTFDLDLVHSREPENLTKLVVALRDVDAHYREKPERIPEERLLLGPGHHLLMTNLGPLDLLGTVKDGREYDDLIERTEVIQLDTGEEITILDLPTLIELKTLMSGDRDRAVLPVLRRVLEEKGKAT